jgi:hypothetical protein
MVAELSRAVDRNNILVHYHNCISYRCWICDILSTIKLLERLKLYVLQVTKNARCSELSRSSPRTVASLAITKNPRKFAKNACQITQLSESLRKVFGQTFHIVWSLRGVSTISLPVAVNSYMSCWSSSFEFNPQELHIAWASRVILSPIKYRRFSIYKKCSCGFFFKGVHSLTYRLWQSPLTQQRYMLLCKIHNNQTHKYIISHTTSSSSPSPIHLPALTRNSCGYALCWDLNLLTPLTAEVSPGIIPIISILLSSSNPTKPLYLLMSKTVNLAVITQWTHDSHAIFHTLNISNLWIKT